MELCYVIVIYGHTVHSMLCRHFDIIRPTSGSLIKNARRWNVKAPLLSLLYLECMSLKTCCICPVFTFHFNTQFNASVDLSHLVTLGYLHLDMVDDPPGVFDVDVVVKSSFIILATLQSAHGLTGTKGLNSSLTSK